jgi:hypothetical protein
MAGGRPTLFTNKMKEIILNIAALGKTDQQIADICGIHQSTLTIWKNKNPEFFASLNSAKELADSEVEATLLNKALGNLTTTETHEGVDATGNVIDKKVVRQVVADTTSMIFWLKNRQPAKWRDQTNIDVSIDGPEFVDE